MTNPTANEDDPLFRHLPTIRSVAELRAQVKDWRAQGLRVALVPTMGALHEGHLSLVQLGLENADRVVTSVFVNPTQFAPGEDFEQYPRNEKKDLALLREAGAHALYAPPVAEMYPDGASTTVHVDGLTDCLCGPVRPGHFDGVATIVTKLLLQGLPDVAIFGEKDYQQLQVIRRLVRDLDIPVDVLGGPIVRDRHGLALSSRNAYLSAEERETALVLISTLRAIADKCIRDRNHLDEHRAWGEAEIRMAGFDRVDYLDIRDAETLAAMDYLDRPARILVAARLGKTRLIDNIPLDPPAR